MYNVNVAKTVIDVSNSFYFFVHFYMKTCEDRRYRNTIT